MLALLLVDTPAIAFTSTTSNRIDRRNAPLRVPFEVEVWNRLDHSLDISNASMLDADVMERKLYWINSFDKVNLDMFCVLNSMS